MDRRTFLRRAALVGTPLAAGCTGGSGDSTSTPTPAAAATATQSPTPGGAQAQHPDYDWGKLAGVDPAPAATVEMRGFEFRPLVAAVEPGTEVTVTNADGSDHTVTVPRLDVDATVDAGGRTAFTPERTGTFDYVCRFHPPGMVGRLVVTEDPPTATPTSAPTATPTASGGGVGY